MRNEPLEELRVQIAAWRKTKKHGDRIPEAVWDRIVAIGRSYPTSIVAKRLSLDFYQLKQRLAAHVSIDSNLTCSKIINIAPESNQRSSASELELLCHITLPSGAVARFFRDCESLRALMMSRSR